MKMKGNELNLHVAEFSLNNYKGYEVINQHNDISIPLYLVFRNFKMMKIKYEYIKKFISTY